MRPLLPLSISHRFRRDDEGAVAITFALASITLFLIIGVGVDYGRMVDMRQRISSAVDAASLAAGRAMLDGKLSNSEIADLAAAYFKNNAHSAQKMGTIGKPKIRIDRNSGTVQIDVTSTLAMTVSRVGGIKTLTIPVTSTATYQQSDVEVGMALDITGSMNDTIGGQRKIDALKAAFETFADRVIPDHPIAGHKARIGLAPYSAGINLGSYAGDASNFRSKDGCVTERLNGNATDATDAFFVAADGTKDVDPTEGSAPYI
jgi:Flp pilus assembly protein TadG